MPTTPHLDRRTVLVLPLLAALSGCAAAGHGAPATAAGATSSPSGSASATAAATEPGVPDVQALVARMSTALQRGDRQAFLDCLSGDAGSARAAAASWFDSVRALPMRVRGLQPVSGIDGWADPGAGQPWTFAFRHQLTGIDRAPVQEWYGAPVVRYDGRWVFGDWGGVLDGDLGTTTRYVGDYRQLWDDGPTRLLRGRRVALLTSAYRDAAACRRALAIVEDGVRRTIQVLGSGGVAVPPEQLLVAVPTLEHRTLFDYHGGVVSSPQASYAGFTRGLPERDAEQQPRSDRPGVSARIVLEPGVLDDEDELRATATHESVHAYLATAWGGEARLPWADEGIAGFVDTGGDEELHLDHLGAAATALDGPIHHLGQLVFDSGTDDTVAGAYATAYAACAYAVATAGLARTLQLLRADRRGDDNPYPAAGFPDAGAFEAGLRRWVKEELA
ncbi:hypothetical protein [Arsenicicoccus sp. oral taxon 190]|uniref:hypothetical protein n=1 Tax=Arsenicicoccus sp. oral taxon 190 TaxID=1658671 RepID=UPI00067A2DE4|nr:hypothetical protein [Arsenicicoccus sp. oral taxon 190]AKT52306.1 hypothetical protein ADJ73_15340 [Arsenicicoccus sp. oral taxon 190]